MSGNAEDSVAAWLHGGVLFESYWYSPGPVKAPPKHSHEEYQFGLCVDSFGAYRYRGSRIVVPVGAMSVIQSGEPHRSRDVKDRSHSAVYPMAYAPLSLLRESADEVVKEGGSEPFFRDLVLKDRDLAGSFLRLFSPERTFASGLEHDSLLLSFLTKLVSRHTAGRSVGAKAGKERVFVRRAREYLEDNIARNVSMEELSEAAMLSPYHLSRVFKEEIGVPPHAYQIQARVGRAKSLLLRGWTASKVASETGFYDQGHFTRHFKRLVGVPPGRYAKNSKNVQATDDGAS